MRRIISLTLGLMLAGGALAGADRWECEEKEEIRRTLRFADPARPGEVSVDNVWGSIAVEGADVRDVELVVHKTIRARNEARLARAKSEAKLEIKDNAAIVEIYLDGPFRCREEGRHGIQWNRHSGYEVVCDFTLKVPRACAVTLRTVTGGDIRVRGVEGAFDVRNVNGRVDIEEAAGAGDAHTVNGGIRIAFRRAPDGDCSFKTVNGKVDLTFPEAPSADFRVKTFNGEAWADFPVEPIAVAPEPGQRRDGKYVYKSGGFSAVRSRRGGVSIQVETLNGDISLHTAK
ncbi:MAG: hypothetical protein JW742_07935 [Candidatus Aminicenantes bacterium]|nr:hypothetical protein [Candidatus Aminicenantes bacterium]